MNFYIIKLGLNYLIPGARITGIYNHSLPELFVLKAALIRGIVVIQF